MTRWRLQVYKVDTWHADVYKDIQVSILCCRFAELLNRHWTSHWITVKPGII